MPLPELALGTAMWGWTVDQPTAFAILDRFYELGGRLIDGATNYPIDKNPDHWRLAENWLQEWIRSHGIQDLQLLMKVGSINNLKSPEHNLSPSFLLFNRDNYLGRFGSNLHALMIHWDNRDRPQEIAASWSALETVQQGGLQIGLSGIKHPELYEDLVRGQRMYVQAKHNLLQSDLTRYADWGDQIRYVVYGINGGGLKLPREAAGQTLSARGAKKEYGQELVQRLEEWLNKQAPSDLRMPNTFNEIAMLYAAYTPGVHAILVGPSRVSQLEESWAWIQALSDHRYQQVYSEVLKVPQSAKSY